MSNWLINGEAVSYSSFVSIATNPQNSIAIEACAGSGKTWLLVSRIVRSLLAGSRPDEILAITFTRKAAAEIRERVDKTLSYLAQSDLETVKKILVDQGVAAEQIDYAAIEAKKLYKKILVCSQPLRIKTFHGWFIDLLSLAPFGASAQANATLTETPESLMAETLGSWLQSRGAELAENVHLYPSGTKGIDSSEKITGDLSESLLNHEGDLNLSCFNAISPANALALLVKKLGYASTIKMLREFTSARVEWQTYAAKFHQPVLAATMQHQLLAKPFIQGRLWKDLNSNQEFTDQLRRYTLVFEQGSPTQRQIAARLSEYLENPSKVSLEAFQGIFLTNEGKIRVLKLNRDTRARAEQIFMAGCVPEVALGEPSLQYVHQQLAQQVTDALNAQQQIELISINACTLIAGVDLLSTYQRTKKNRGVFDFPDLELEVVRLLEDPETAAYMFSRLDQSIKHILIDEFQDTNPMQWRAIRAWVDAYQDIQQSPTVFIVGDPKQSIYRFRRAEVRLFSQAIAYLKIQLNAFHLRTNQTRRNALAIVEVINQTFETSDYPIYQPQSTVFNFEGRVVKLLPNPSVSDEMKSSADEVDNIRDALIDPLVSALPAQASEAAQLSAAIQSLVGCFCIEDAGEMRLTEFRDIFILVQKRTHLQHYEQALRSAQIPFVSARQGVLLDTLESLDLDALLTFLASPWDNMALAHLLRTPVFSLSETELYQLADVDSLLANHVFPSETPSNQLELVQVLKSSSWWDRLGWWSQQNHASFKSMYQQLSQWLIWAKQVPIHDALDRIFSDGQFIVRYAAVAPAEIRQQVVANLRELLALSLETNSGRYPSPLQLREELRMRRNAHVSEAPDEAKLSHLNAVRVLTIHGAKGLEAPIVFMPDSGAKPNLTIKPYQPLIVWPPGEAAPIHFSMMATSPKNDLACSVWIDQELSIQANEIWNLQYVAMTRAAQLLVFTCADSVIHPDSMYARVPDGRVLHQSTEEFTHTVKRLNGFPSSFSSHTDSIKENQKNFSETTSNVFELFEFNTPNSIKKPYQLSPQSGFNPINDVVLYSENQQQRRQNMGILLHRLLEQSLLAAELVLLELPDQENGLSLQNSLLYLSLQRLLSSFSLELSFADCLEVLQALKNIYQGPARFLVQDTTSFYAENEVTLIEADGQICRIDRLVEFSTDFWVVDFKLDFRPVQEAQYRSQLLRYAQAVKYFVPIDKVLRLALVVGDGQLIEYYPDGSPRTAAR